MSADQDNFSIRYRKPNPGKTWEKKRGEIADFVFDFADKVGITADGDVTHYTDYSEILLEEAMGHVGDFCGLPDEMIKKYPDVQFEFHFVEWYGDVSDYVVIYDGKKMYSHELEIGIAPESSNGDPYLIPEEWPCIELDDSNFMQPYFYYVNSNSKDLKESADNEGSKKVSSQDKSVRLDSRSSEPANVTDYSAESSSEEENQLLKSFCGSTADKKTLVIRILKGENLDVSDVLPVIMANNSNEGTLLGGLWERLKGMETLSAQNENEKKSSEENDLIELFYHATEDNKKLASRVLNEENLAVSDFFPTMLSPNQSTTGRRMTLKEVRKKTGLSQDDFAKSIGISSSAIASIESGRIKPNAKIIEAVKNVHGEVIT